MAQRVLFGEVERTTDAKFFWGALQKKMGDFWFLCKKNSNFVCYERGACWQLPSLMRFLFDLKYDANEIQNFPFVGGVCADVCFGRRQTEGG